MFLMIARLSRRLVLVVLFLALVLPALPVQKVSAGTHCVNPGGTGGCFAHIQAAIDDSGTVDGDTINIEANNPLQMSYQENVTASKSVILIGADKNTTMLDGSNTGPGITISPGKSVSISHLRITATYILAGTIVSFGALSLLDIWTDYIVNNSASPLTATNSQVGGINNISTGMVTVNNCLGGGFTNAIGTMFINNTNGNTYSSFAKNTGSGTITVTGGVLGGAENSGVGSVILRGVTDNNAPTPIKNTGPGTITATDSTILAPAINGVAASANVGTLTFVNTTVMSVVAYGTGGGVTLTNSKMVGGTSYGLIGIINNGSGSIALTNSSILWGPYGYCSGISNLGNGTVTVINSSIYRCTTSQGGGIFNKGTVTVLNSSIDHNFANDNNAAHGGGGGIYNDVGGALTVINSTLTGNGTGGSIGGGIINLGVMKLINDTVSGNDAPQGGGVANYATLYYYNTVIAANTASNSGPDIFGAASSGGHNLIGNTSGGSGFVGSDLLNVNPQLGLFAANGGPTFTMALLPGSPAIGAGDPAICAAAPPNGAGGKDQRGLNRAPDTCSIGSYEIQPNALPPPKPTASPGGSPTALPPPRPTVPPPGAGTPTPNPLPPSRP